MRTCNKMPQAGLCKGNRTVMSESKINKMQHRSEDSICQKYAVTKKWRSTANHCPHTAVTQESRLSSTQTHKRTMSLVGVSEYWLISRPDDARRSRIGTGPATNKTIYHQYTLTHVCLNVYSSFFVLFCFHFCYRF